MSVIENALRRAQDQKATALEPAPELSMSPAAVVSVAVQPSPQERVVAARSLFRRRPSIATMLLIVLTAATLIILRQPGWGGGFRHWLEAWYPEPGGAAVVPPQVAAGEVAPASVLPSMPTGRAEVSRTNSDALYHAPTADASAERIGTSIISPMPASLVGLTDVASAAGSVSSATANSPAGAPPTGGTAAPRRSGDVQSRFLVSGIMLSGRTRMAVINGAIVAEGERIENAVVRAVSPQSVTIEIEGHTYQLGLRTAN